MENPPQMTWQSQLTQRFYDCISVRAGGGLTDTERQTILIEMAIKEVETAIATAFAAGERARSEALLEKLPKEEGQLDKNDPDNYEACYAIAGHNHYRNKMLALISKDLWPHKPTMLVRRKTCLLITTKTYDPPS